MVSILFNLSIGGKSTGKKEIKADNATLELKWALTPEGLKKLERDDIKEPYMLIVIAAPNSYNCDFHEDYHQLIPLKNHSTYIPFFRPGTNYVHASIVYHSQNCDFQETDGKIRDYYLGMSSYTKEYDFLFITDEGEFELDELHIGYQKIQVEVAKELFAPEPPAWKKSFIKFVLDKQQTPVDQCHLRKLLLKSIAYSFWYILKMIWRTIVVLGCLLVTLNVSLKPIVHPIKMSYSDIYEGKEPIWFRNWQDKNGDSHETWYLFFLSPIYWIIVALIYLAIAYQVFKTGFNIAQYGLALIIGVTAIFSIISILALIVYTAERIKESKKNTSKTIAGKYQNLLEGQEANVSLVIEVTHNFEKLKSKVCKPFPRA